MRLLLCSLFFVVLLIKSSTATPYDVFAITEISKGNTCGAVQEYRLTKMNVCTKNKNEFRVNYSNGTYVQYFSCPKAGCQNLKECTILKEYPIGLCSAYGKTGSLSAFTKFPHYSISIHPFIQTFSLIGNSYESCSNEPHSYIARKHQTCLITEDVILPESDCKSTECLQIQQKKSGQFVCGNQVYFFHGYDNNNCTGPMKIFNMTENSCKNSTEGYSRILQCSDASKITSLLMIAVIAFVLILF